MNFVQLTENANRGARAITEIVQLSARMFEAAAICLHLGAPGKRENVRGDSLRKRSTTMDKQNGWRSRQRIRRGRLFATRSLGENSSWYKDDEGEGERIDIPG